MDGDSGFIIEWRIITTSANELLKVKKPVLRKPSLINYF